MSMMDTKPGSFVVGQLVDLSQIEASIVMCLRLWRRGPVDQPPTDDAMFGLDHQPEREVWQRFVSLCELCARYGRRSLRQKEVDAPGVGADEACFINFINTAAEGDRDDALLIAMLLVRPDVAPAAVALAAQVGLGLRRTVLRGATMPSFTSGAQVTRH